MSSIANYLKAPSDDHRESCYECENQKGGKIKFKGQNMYLECRRYTEVGNEIETRLSARETDIFTTNLIHIVEIGVDAAKFSWGKKMKMKAQSRGGGGLSKYECGTDYQSPTLIRHDKKAFTELLYVHTKNCMKTYIGTEMQDMIYRTGDNGDYADSYDTDNLLSDMIVSAARDAVAEAVQFTDIVGVYGGPDSKSNAYDGIFAQAYHAYNGVAFYMSVKFTYDFDTIVDGQYIHAKYGGCQINVQYDSTLPSDPTMNRYATTEEVMGALTDWLNKEIVSPNGSKYVDATYSGNDLYVISRYAEIEVDLLSFFDSKATVSSWADCNISNVSYEILQGCMPIDERPVLVKYQKYTLHNILQALPRDLYQATCRLDDTLLRAGQEWGLYIDSNVWKMYRQALKTRPSDASAYNIEDDMNVYTLDALSQMGGTGLWFITAQSSTESLRNVKHFIDTNRGDLQDIYIGLTSNCREVEILYDTLHGVGVEDWRLFASNLLCSNFEDYVKDKTPWAKTLPMIPCLNPKVRSCYTDYNELGKECSIRASFTVASQYKNGAYYYDPDSEEIKVLNAGDTIPENAVSVYEIELKNTTTGIPVGSSTDVQYEYHVTTSDGISLVYNVENPIIQYAGDITGLTYNVVQKVMIPNLCSDTYNAASQVSSNYPFVTKGSCDDIVIDMEAIIEEDGGDYTLTIVDNTVWPTGDGIQNLEGTVGPNDNSTAAQPLTEIPNMLSIDDYSLNQGTDISITIENKYGCSYTVGATAQASGNSFKLS